MNAQQKKNIEQARNTGRPADILRLVTRAPQDIDLLLAAGLALRDLRDYEDAIRVWNQVLDQDPEQIQALEQKALCQMRLNPQHLLSARALLGLAMDVAQRKALKGTEAQALQGRLEKELWRQGWYALPPSSRTGTAWRRACAVASSAALNAAIAAYQQAFLDWPDDRDDSYYPAINAVTLTALRAELGITASCDELEQRWQSAAERVRASMPAAASDDYWSTATRLEYELVSGAPLRTVTALAEQAVAAARGNPFYLDSTWQQLVLMQCLGYRPAIVQRVLDLLDPQLPVPSALPSGTVAADGAPIVSASSAMREPQDRLARFAASEMPVLITGESGTGKELAAAAVHQCSLRSDKAYCVVNCAAVPATLIESILFGHIKGAFTGAGAAKDGLFKAADGGTLFLDEIGEMPVDMQPKLLRALDPGKITPVGSTAEVSVDVRLVCATNKSLPELVAADGFRRDLYYRLSAAVIHLPPLRERHEDILPLALQFLDHFCSKRGKRGISGFSSATQILLQRYRWPGNIRELKGCIERAVLLADSGPLQPEHLWDDPDTLLDPSLPAIVNDDTRKLIEVLARHQGNQVAAHAELVRTGAYRKSYSAFNRLLKRLGIA